MLSPHRGVLFLVVLLVTSSAALAQSSRKANRLARSVAQAHGLAAFDSIDEIRFTFNFGRGGRTSSRTWHWRPAQDAIRLQEADAEPIAVVRGTLDESSPEELRRTDAKFINDRFWLMFPFHLAWDENLTFTVQDDVELPIGEGRARLLRVAYPDVGGYTPGDVYDVYLGDGHRILQWGFRRGGVESEARPITWEAPVSFGPLELVLDHRSEGGARLWFSDVAVRFVGSDRWVEAE
ncbi:MAG: hypothetical protein AAF533_21355 [Acidobacteriota bacterium]